MTVPDILFQFRKGRITVLQAWVWLQRKNLSAAKVNQALLDSMRFRA